MNPRIGRVAGRAVAVVAMSAGLAVWIGAITGESVPPRGTGVLEWANYGGPCTGDDGAGPRPCYWDAAVHGNGQGRSFYVDVAGAIVRYAR